jgi:pilus assembly protein TadC
MGQHELNQEREDEMELLALGLAGWAAHLAVPGPPRTVEPPPRGWTRPRWLQPRPDAMSARLRWGLGVAAGALAYLLGEGMGVLPALLIGVVVAAGIGIGLGRIEPGSAQRAREQRIRDLPHTLDLLAGCLSCGLPLRRAVREVAAATPGVVGEDLGLVVGLVDVGVSERAAWLRLAERPAWTGIARDVGRAAEAGSGLQGVLARHAERARRNAQAHRQQRARTLGVRSVLPLMTCFLPAFVVIGIVPSVGSIMVRVLGG